MQQITEHLAVGDIGQRRRDRMNQLGLTVDPNVCLHPQKPMVTLASLMHLRVSLALLVLGRTRGIDDAWVLPRFHGHFREAP